MDILSYILSKKNNGSSIGGSGGGGSNASVSFAGGGTLVNPTQTYSRLYFNTKLTNEEIMALMDTLELTYAGMGNMLYITIYNSGEMDGILAAVMADTGTYFLGRLSTGEALFAINGNALDETITFTGWNPNIDLSNGIEISGETFGTELPMDGGPVPVGANNDKIVNLFSSEPIKEPINKGLSGVYDGNDLEVGSTHIDVSSLIDEHKLPFNIDVVDSNLIPKNIVEGVNILGVEGTYSGIIPSGEKAITTTTSVDVSQYASAKIVDKNLIPTNIARGISVLGITGTYAGIEDDLITRTIKSCSNDRVTKIAPYVFWKCTSLTTANFPQVTSIGEYAFDGCTNLTTANFPQATSIGQRAFNECRYLLNIDFSKVISIKEYAFANSGVITASFPQATSIGEYAFQYCNRLTTANFPQATSIGEYAFQYCNRLTTANFPQVTSIGGYAFTNCTKLTTLTDADFPKVTSIETYAFYSTALTSIIFPQAKNIRSHAFYQCKSLMNIDLPQATSIGESAFERCTSLTTVSLPQATTTGDIGFADCTSLTDVHFPQATTIEHASFSRCTSLIDVDCPQATHIGYRAFYQCQSLTNITLPQATTLESDIFEECAALTTVNIPQATSIQDFTFHKCYSLTKIFISQTDVVCAFKGQFTFHDCYHILGETNATYNPNGLKDGYIYVPASLLSQYKVATNWYTHASQIIGHEDLEAGATLPNYTTDKFTTQTWYSDERLTTIVTEVATSGKYYCRLEA